MSACIEEAMPMVEQQDDVRRPSRERPTATERVFRRLLLNTLVTGVTSSFLWFALTFWVYLETRSVVATGVIGARLQPLVGVARARRSARTSTATASTARWSWPRRSSVVCFAAATVVFVAVDADEPARSRAARGSGSSSA